MTAQFTLVQSGSASNGTGNVTLALPSQDTSGNFLVAGISSSTLTPLIPPNSNWQLAQSVASGASAGHVEIWYLLAESNPGGDTAFLFTGSPGAGMRGAVCEYALPSSAYRAVLESIGQASGTGGTTMNVGSACGNCADALGIAFFNDVFSVAPSSASWSAPTGYTSPVRQANVLNSWQYSHNLDVAQGNQSLTGAGYSTTTNEKGWAAAYATFRANRFTRVAFDGGEDTNAACWDPTGQVAMLAGDVEGLFRTCDNGNNWQPSQYGIGPYTQHNVSIAWSLIETNTVYALTEAGLMVSADGGSQWTLRNGTPSPNAQTVPSPPRVAGLPGNADRSCGNHQIAQDTTNSLLYICDYKAIWKGTGSPPGTSVTNISPTGSNFMPRCVAVNPTTPTHLYCGAWSTSTNGGLYYSANSGSTWTQYTGYTGTVADCVIVGSNIYIVAEYGGVYRGGLTGGALTSLNGNGTDTNIVVNNSTGWLGIDGYVDGSGNHQIIAACADAVKPAGKTNYQFAIQLTLPGGGTSGMTWTDLANQAGGSVNYLTMPPDNRVWWLPPGAGPSYQNYIGGNKWSNTHVAINPANPDIILLNGAGAAYRTEDGGMNWTICDNGMTLTTTHDFAIDASNANHIVLVSSDFTQYETFDPYALAAGQYAYANPPGAGTESHCVAIDPADAVVYTGINKKFASNSGGLVYARAGTINAANNGPWNEIGYGTGGNAGQGFAPMGLYAGRDGSNNRFICVIADSLGLIRAQCPAGADYTNAANWTWTTPTGGSAIGTSGTLAAGIPVNTFDSKSQTNNTLYCYDRKAGIFRSADYGQSWTHIWTMSDSPAPTVNNVNTGLMALNAAVTGELWVSCSTGFYKLSNANTGTVAGGQITVTKITTSGVTTPGPLDTYNGNVYLCSVPVTGQPEVKIVTNASGSWADIGATELAQYVFSPLQLKISSAGRLFLATGYNIIFQGSLTGTGSSTLAVTTTSLPNGQVGVAYPGALAASGGTPPYTWTLASGTLPTGVTLNSDGSFSGSPTTTTGSPFTATYTVTDSATPTPGTATSGSLSITVTAALLDITTASLPNGTLGTAYSQSVQAVNGTGPYTWSLASGSLPTGLSLGSSTTLVDTISGTPTASGLFAFTLQITDSSSPTHQSDQQGLSINIPAGGLVITTTSLPGGTTGVAYSQTLAATGGAPPYTWAQFIDPTGILPSNPLPAGLSLNTSTGVISGTPTTPGDNGPFTIQVTDSLGTTGYAEFDIPIALAGQALGIGSISTRSLPTAIGSLAIGASAVQGIGYEVFVFDYQDFTTLLVQLPRVINLQFSKMVNDKGSGQIQLNLDDTEFWNQTLPNGQPGEYLLDFENLWQVRKDGIPIFEFLGETVEEQLLDPSEQRIVTVTGPGTIQTLTWARAMPPGFPNVIFKTDALSDSFDEVNENGVPTLDTAKWNLSTPLSDISLVPAGAIGSNSAGTNPNVPQYYLGTCYLNPNNNTVFLGAGTYDITNSVLSAQILPIAGTSLDGSQQTSMFVQNVNNSNQFAQMAVTAAGLSAQVGHGSGNISSKNFGPYSATSHAFWQITEQDSIFYFWTSADGQSWAKKWVVPHVWTPKEVDVFFAAFYDSSGQQVGVSAINQDVITPTVSGNLYYNEPTMAIWLDQLSMAKSRGTIPFVTTRMTSQGDSFGNGWTDTQSLQVTNGTDLYSLLQGMCAAVNADFMMEPGFLLNVGLPSSKPGSDGLGIGADHSAGTKMVLLRESRKQLTKQRTRARDSIANLIGSINSDNTIVTAQDEDSQDTWLQREGWVQTGATVTESANQIAADASVAQTSGEVLSWTLTIAPGQAGATAFKDFQVGDWVAIETPGIPATNAASATQAVRVVAIAIQVDQQGLETVELTVNSYRQWMQEQLAYLAQKFGGDFVSTNGTQQITNQTTNPVGLPSVVSPELGGLGDVIVSP